MHAANRRAILSRAPSKAGARLHFTKDEKVRAFFTVNCTVSSKARNYLAKRGRAPFAIPYFLTPILMPKGKQPADEHCFAAHLYMPQSREEKNRQKARYMARIYRKERAKYVNCALSLTEYAELQRQAETVGCTPTTYLRKAAFAYVEHQQILPKAIEERMSELVVLLRNMANNLNQIARRTNQTTKLGFFDAVQARKTVLDLEKSIKEFINNPHQR